MSWLCWNVRGLGNRRTIRDLEALVQAQDPVAMFLSETWANKDRLRSLCNKLNFDHAWIVPRINSTGCLSLFWKKTIQIKVISSSPNHVDTIVGGSGEDRWCFTGIYGFRIQEGNKKLGLCCASYTGVYPFPGSVRETSTK